MRVAVVMSGKINRYKIEECLISIKKHIVKPFSADIFCSFWDFEIDLNQEIAKLINPTLIQYVPYNDSIKQYIQSISLNCPAIIGLNTSFKTMAMYFQILQANKMREFYQQSNGFIYDVVIRIRPDIVVNSFEITLPLQEKSIYMSDKKNMAYGMSDTLFTTNNSTFNYISYNFTNFCQLMSKSISWHPELYLNLFLTINDIRIIRIRNDHNTTSESFTYNI